MIEDSKTVEIFRKLTRIIREEFPNDSRVWVSPLISLTECYFMKTDKVWPNGGGGVAGRDRPGALYKYCVSMMSEPWRPTLILKFPDVNWDYIPSNDAGFEYATDRIKELKVMEFKQ